MPAMKAVGTNTEHSTSVMAITGPVISSIALMVASRGGRPFRHPPLDVLDDHDGVIDHDADGQHQPEQRQVVQARSPAAAMTANVPISDTGTSIIGISVARQSCRKISTTMNTRTNASNSVL